MKMGRLSSQNPLVRPDDLPQVLLNRLHGSLQDSNWLWVIRGCPCLAYFQAPQHLYESRFEIPALVPVFVSWELEAAEFNHCCCHLVRVGWNFRPLGELVLSNHEVFTSSLPPGEFLRCSRRPLEWCIDFMLVRLSPPPHSGTWFCRAAATLLTTHPNIAARV
jgi:hypothetical protein